MTNPDHDAAVDFFWNLERDAKAPLGESPAYNGTGATVRQLEAAAVRYHRERNEARAEIHTLRHKLALAAKGLERLNAVEAQADSLRIERDQAISDLAWAKAEAASLRAVHYINLCGGV
jgi:hypothetical protein